MSGCSVGTARLPQQLTGRASAGAHGPSDAHSPPETESSAGQTAGLSRTPSSMTKHEFEVAMTCEGCSGAVTRVLNKLGGVTFEIDLPKKLVWIESDKDVEVLEEALKKCGKEVKYNGTK